MNLDNGVYLRTNQMRALAVVVYPTYTLSVPRLPWFDFVGSSVERHPASCWAAAQSYQSWAVSTTVSVHTLAFLFSSPHLSDLQAPATFPGSFFQSRSSASFLPPLFSTTPLQVFRSYCFSAPALSESLECPLLPMSLSLNMIKWMMLSCHLNWKIYDMQPLIAHHVIKVALSQ